MILMQWSNYWSNMQGLLRVIEDRIQKTGETYFDAVMSYLKERQSKDEFYDEVDLANELGQVLKDEIQWEVSTLNFLKEGNKIETSLNGCFPSDDEMEN